MAKPVTRREASRRYNTDQREQGHRVATGRNKEDVGGAPKAITRRVRGNDAQKRT
jgi:hypothetical protein